MNKMAYKMEEGDPWFEEKTLQVEQMESQLRKLYSLVELVVGCRRELAMATGQFSLVSRSRSRRIGEQDQKHCLPGCSTAGDH